MEKKQKYLMSIIIVLVVVIAGVAVGFHYLTPSQSTLKGNTIIIASSATPSSLDPAVAFDTNSVFFDDQM